MIYLIVGVGYLVLGAMFNGWKMDIKSPEPNQVSLLYDMFLWPFELICAGTCASLHVLGLDK